MTEYSVEYAKSARSSCKVCKANIELGAVRVGTSAPGPGDYMLTSWRHLECQKKPKNLADLSGLSGLSALGADDQAKVAAWHVAASATASGGGNKRAAEEAPALMGDPKKMKAAELKAALKAHGLPEGGKKAEKLAALQEVSERAAAEVAYGKLSVAELKGLCELNGQRKAGAKAELVERCADGKLYGALPRCTACGGGQLRVRYAAKFGHGGQGTFSCPGFYDDDAFQRCAFSATSAERAAWREA